MARKLFLLIILFLLISLIALPLSSGCKVNILTPEKVSNGTEDPSLSEETVEGETVVDEAPETEETESIEEVQEENEDIIIAEIKSISPEEVYEIINNGEDYLIVDVRTKEEYDSGHLGGALLLPVQELEDRLNELAIDKPIIVYCRSGVRSKTAATILVENGFKQVYDMGGINDWNAKGYPIIVEE